MTVVAASHREQAGPPLDNATRPRTPLRLLLRGRFDRSKLKAAAMLEVRAGACNRQSFFRIGSLYQEIAAERASLLVDLLPLDTGDFDGSIA